MASYSTNSEISEKRTNHEVDYDGLTKFCKCRKMGFKVKAHMWTSWTDKNPGKRFYGCPNYEVKGCGYFEWHDVAASAWFRDIINILKWEKKLLIAENSQLKERLRVGLPGGVIENEIDELWNEVERVKILNKEDIEKMKKFKKVGFVLVVISWFILSVVLVFR